MDCILCRTPMHPKTIEDVELDLCPNCRGVWLADGDLKLLSGIDPELGRVLTCCECDTIMNTKIVDDVEIDICPNCKAIWLDDGELQKLAKIDPQTGKRSNIDILMNELKKYGFTKVD